MKWVEFGYRKIHEEKVSFQQPTRAKHETSFNTNAFWVHFGGWKTGLPQFRSLGVFRTRVPAEVLHVVHDGWELFQDELHPNTSGGSKKESKLSHFGCSKFTPYGLSWERGIYFAGDSPEWKFDLLMNFLLNFVLPESLCRLAGWGREPLRRDFFARRKTAVCFCKIDWGIDHLFERSSTDVLCNHGKHDSFW